MTAIIGFCADGVAWIGGDSAGCSGHDLTVRKDAKVFECGEFLFGCTSSFRMIQILRYNTSMPSPTEKDLEDKFGFIVTRFVPAIQQALSSGKYDTDGNKGGTFLVAWRGEIYQVDSDYQVAQAMNNIYGIGCGGDYGKAALTAMLDMPDGDGRSGEELISRALKVAETYSGGVRGPFIIKKQQ